MPANATQILLVEDNPADARLVQHLLSEVDAGRFRVTLARSLGEALVKISHTIFDAILVDLSLPDSFGLDTLRQISLASSSVPIIVLSAVHDETFQLETAAAGAEDYLVKGHGDGNDIARVIRYATERKRATETYGRRERLLAEAERTAHIGNWVWDLARGECQWSDGVYRIFGYEPHAFPPTYERFLDCIFEGDRSRVAESIEAAQRGQRSYALEHRVLRPDGTVRVVHNRGEIEFDNSGKPQRLLGILKDLTERVRAEQVLHATEERLRLVVDAVAEGIFGVDLDGICTFANPACVRMLGYASEAALVGQRIHDLAHHTRRDGSSCPAEECPIYATYITGDECHVDDDIMWRKDGTSFDVEYRTSPLRVNGKLSGAVTIFADITERRLVQEALAESEQRFRGAFETAAHGMALVSTEGRFVKVNQSLCNIVGYSPDELMATNFQTITHKDDLERDLDSVHKLLRGEIDRYQMEKRYWHKDGHLVWILLSVSLVRDSDGQPVHFVSQIQDITARKQAEEALRQTRDELEQRVVQRTTHLEQANRWLEEEIARRERTEETLRRERDFSSALLDTLGALVVVLDADARIVRFNRACEQATGYTFGEVRGRVFSDFLLDPSEKSAVNATFRSLRAGHFPNKYDNFWVAKNGDKRLISWSNTALIDELGVVEHVIATGIDITEKRKMEELEHQHLAELAHVSRLSVMGEMATEIAHELNQPLSSIVNYGNACRRLLKSSNPDADDVDVALHGVIEQAQRAAEIIRRLRSFLAKGDSRRSTADINELVREVCKLADADIRAHRTRLTLRLGTGLPLVRVDIILIEQVILNLVRNAIDAMAEVAGGRRELRIDTARAAGNRIQVDVTDTGPGIGPDVVQRLFEPFFTTKQSGIGMGLAICRSIVEGHGGQLWVTPDHIGGASFHFTLPVQTENLT